MGPCPDLHYLTPRPPLHGAMGPCPDLHYLTPRPLSLEGEGVPLKVEFAFKHATERPYTQLIVPYPHDLQIKPRQDQRPFLVLRLAFERLVARGSWLDP